MLLLLLIALFAIPTSKLTAKDSMEAFPPTPLANPWDKSCGHWCQAARVAGGVGAIAGIAYAVKYPKQAKDMLLNAPKFVKKQALNAVEQIKKAQSWVGSQVGKLRHGKPVKPVLPQ